MIENNEHNNFIDNKVKVQSLVLNFQNVPLVARISSLEIKDIFEIGVYKFLAHKNTIALKIQDR